MTFSITYRRIDALSAAEWEEILALTERFTEGTRAVMERSVREKQEVALVRSRDDGRLLGMSTMDTYPVNHGGQPRVVIYAGNVVFDERARGALFVHRIGFRCFVRARLRHPLRPIDFFFDTYGFRSYALIARALVEFWPRPDVPTPPAVAAYLDALGAARYGAAWDAARGVCHAGDKRLKPWIGEPSPAHLADPSVAFYVARNPGYATGEMLAVLVPLHFANWRAIFWHAMRRRFHRTPARPA